MLGSTGICITYSSGTSLSPPHRPWRCWQHRGHFSATDRLCVSERKSRVSGKRICHKKRIMRPRSSSSHRQFSSNFGSTYIKWKLFLWRVQICKKIQNPFIDDQNIGSNRILEQVALGTWSFGYTQSPLSCMVVLKHEVELQLVRELQASEKVLI